MPELDFSTDFYCPLPCKTHFVTDQYTENEDGEFVAECPKCGKLVPKISIGFKNLLNTKRTGPRTPEGKARCAQNLDGHRGKRNSEEARRRSSMNNFKHGRYSKHAHLVAPALAGHYAACDNCPIRDDCEAKAFDYCPRYVEAMVNFIAAYKNSDPKSLQEIAALSQARMYMMFEMVVNSVFSDGVSVVEKIRRGNIEEERYRSNPLLKEARELVKTLGFDAESQEMTPKSQDETDALQGNLQANKSTLDEVRQEMAENTKAVQDAIRNASKNRDDDSDPSGEREN